MIVLFLLIFVSGAILLAGAEVGLIGFLICFSVVGCFWLFVYIEYKNYNTEQGKKQYREQRKRQKNYENNYGIIEHKDK